MKLYPFTKSDYSGGLNSTASLREIASNEATVLHDWDITYQGQLRRRNGLIQIGNTSPSPISGMGAFIRDGGLDMLRTQGQSLEYLNGLTWTVLENDLVLGNPFWFENVQVLGKIYFGNTDNTLKSWGRLSTTLNSSLTDLGSSVPHGNVNIWYKNFMFILNDVKVGSTLYTNDLFWSNLGDPDTYDTTNNHASIQGDGRLITAVPMGDQLVLFKERSIQYLTGFGNTDWKITASNTAYNSVSEEVGCVAPRGACQVGDEVWFIDNQAIIRRVVKTDFDAFRHQVISTKIQGSLAGINKVQLAQAVMWSWNNKVYCAVPNGTDNINSLVFVFDILAAKRLTPNAYTAAAEAWTTYTGWFPSVAISYPTNTTIDLYLGDATTGKTYIHAGLDDNGVAIDAVYEDGNNDYGLVDQYKNYQLGYVTAEAIQNNVSIYIDSSIDTLPYVNNDTLLLTSDGTLVGPSGNARCGPTGNARCGGSAVGEKRFFYGVNNGQLSLGKRIRHRIRHKAVQQQPTVNSYSSYFKPRSIR